MDVLNEIFSKEGESIHRFKKGDIIIRLKTQTKKVRDFNDNLGIIVEREVEGEMSFRKEPGELVGIYNNLIYVKRLDFALKGSIVALPIEDYSENWALFEIPEGLTLEDCL